MTRWLAPTVRLFGADVRLHPTWILVFPAVVGALGLGRFAVETPGWPAPVTWGAAVGVAVLSLAALFVHEASHALAARWRRVPYGPSTLYFFGGVESVERPATSALDEGLIAAAGPIASLALAGILVAVGAPFVGAVDAPVSALAATAEIGAGLSALVAIVNLVPGEPLDGGRIAHSIAWRLTGDRARALRIAARTGRAAGLLLIGAGLAVALAGDVADSLVIVLAGWFLRTGATASERRAAIRELVEDVTVADAMDPDAPTISSQLTLDTFAPQVLDVRKRDAFAVTRDGETVGVLGVGRLRRLGRHAWPTTRAGDAMTPLGSVRALAPDEPLWPALQELQQTGEDALPVLRDGAFVGLLTRVSAARLVADRVRATGRTL